MNFIDLFAGAGGLSEGFIRAGFTPIAHVEMDKAACYSLRTRTAYHYLKANNQYSIYVSYLRGEISREKLYKEIPDEVKSSIINLPVGPEHNETIHKTIKSLLGKQKVDLIIGGPPCQAYSLAGRSRSATKMEGDPRNYLFVEYANYLAFYKPKMFVFENVLGLKSAKRGFYLEQMEKLFLDRGYKMKLFTVEANNFGVLQRRRRVIIIGWKKDLNLEIPNLEEVKHQTKSTVADVLVDLPVLLAGAGIDKYQAYAGDTNQYLINNCIRNGIDVLTQHISRPHNQQDKKIYRIAIKKWKRSGERLNYNDLPDELKTHNNRTSFFDRFKVVADDLPYSQTVVAHIAKDGHYYIHPDIKQIRSLTVREAARLQSFPDDYYFEGVKPSDIKRKLSFNRTAAFKQIGNAVPPLMAYAIAKSIMKIL
ncbi:DNA cytosine methyltransferase [Aridibaculum aurantiacum]|uniref:DNA cytosine methyltransferase n=1 Tax=Aridibaculum aurantiacum TaxID=2810307 RepID=UPI001A974474|nr:DNA (cytosine-5-)-methyltransferase [Aridibaculum aurantiacum]